MLEKINTEYWMVQDFVDKAVGKCDHSTHLQEAARLINADEVVAFPTETVYGLGANALSDKAVRKIFQAKGRPNDNPLIVHVANIETVDKIVDNIPKQALLLMKVFWPGPLTIVLPRVRFISPEVTAGLTSVAVRMPDHPLALALINACQKPLAAPSANRSGKPSPTSADHVLHDLDGLIAGVLDGGLAGIGLESTVVDVTGAIPVILRPGVVTQQDLEAVVGPVLGYQDSGQIVQQQEKDKPKSPGVKYQHYAPNAPLSIVSLDGGVQHMREVLIASIKADHSQGLTVGILTTNEGLPVYQSYVKNEDVLASVGARGQPDDIARQIYAVLRQFDAENVDRIYAESFQIDGVGEAIMNRLLKAANGRIMT